MTREDRGLGEVKRLGVLPQGFRRVLLRPEREPDSQSPMSSFITEHSSGGRHLSGMGWHRSDGVMSVVVASASSLEAKVLERGTGGRAMEGDSDRVGT